MEVESCEGEQTPLAGRNAVLKCAIVGEPAPELVWFKDGARIAEPDARRSLDAGATELSIHNFDPALDDGHYEVVANQVQTGVSLRKNISVHGLG